MQPPNPAASPFRFPCLPELSKKQVTTIVLVVLALICLIVASIGAADGDVGNALGDEGIYGLCAAPFVLALVAICIRETATPPSPDQLIQKEKDRRKNYLYEKARETIGCNLAPWDRVIMTTTRADGQIERLQLSRADFEAIEATRSHPQMTAMTQHATLYSIRFETNAGECAAEMPLQNI